jgi:hypothetical protein
MLISPSKIVHAGSIYGFQKFCLMFERSAEYLTDTFAAVVGLTWPSALTIKELNNTVTKHTVGAVKDAEARGLEVSPEVVKAMGQRTTISCGGPLFKERTIGDRSLFLVFVLMIMGGVTHGAWHFGIGVSLVNLLFWYIYFDFYSGLVHLVLDEKLNLNLPFLGQSCLEFQWHHIIPDDISRQGLLAACASVNDILLATVIVHALGMLLLQGRIDLLSVHVCAWKMSMAYVGQFSHCMAHDVHGRSAFVRKLQEYRIIAPMASHHIHHKAPHNTNYSLLGRCDFVVEGLIAVAPSHKVHVALMAVLFLCDSHVVTAMIKCCV